MKIKKQKGISSSLGIVIIVIVAIVAVGGALAYQYMWSSDEPIEEIKTETPKDETADEPIEEIKTKTPKDETAEIEFEKKIIELADKNSFIPGEIEEVFSNKIQKNTIVFGDLNGDNVKDVAYITVSWGGGTGFFRDLVITLNEDGNIGDSASIYLGDRPEIKSITIEDNIITVDKQEWQGSRYIAKFRLSEGELIREEMTKVDVKEEVTKDKVSDWQVYRNKEYGFYVRYPESDYFGQYKVEHIENTFYVAYSSYEDITKGQFVRIFTKNSEDSLKEAIEKRFLKDFSNKECFVDETDLNYSYE